MSERRPITKRDWATIYMGGLVGTVLAGSLFVHDFGTGGLSWSFAVIVFLVQMVIIAPVMLVGGSSAVLILRALRAETTGPRIGATVAFVVCAIVQIKP